MLLRDAVGSTLRDVRTLRGRSLRDVAGAAAVSLGYLSEVERGRKEVSSELLAAVCSALEVSVAAVLVEAARTLAAQETWAPAARPVPATSPALAA